MDSFKETAQACVEEISMVISHTKEEELEAIAQGFKQARRIFISGDGRSGLMGKAIAMRLMHGGYEVYVVGETITPSIGEGDVLLLVSGSATGVAARLFIKKAKQAGAKVMLVTANRETEFGDLCDTCLFVPAATKQRKPDEPKTIQPLGNQFDQSIHLLLDAIVVKLTKEKQAEMKARHANLE
ncbi:6-phospho-3-hexuloisomerase [Shouchella clausii]|uniref:6-phospho-3-hexuloisomerase n=1 Tax=Shouchella clausii TaxID=79880 RepID=A0A268RVX2_SHOCL|nr:6-phospho-3-hexuloisomerase [Shouchella clausii]MBU8596393.1 6-phospho-3-hexuloisomerase [Shouchella clausii]MCY1104052.1 6-phospho-3-hexuloisomerase [Shouchella clausii]MED4160075.1 6-phospho-3-hexuloisomerase [Shouchella clausii]MED4178290.1 6-phospho-3-hexuloisomerase [Shouchella clausii]PAD09327.1 6-phospho-3-hexuloisomerase [Shouchella clausii]